MKQRPGTQKSLTLLRRQQGHDAASSIHLFQNMTHIITYIGYYLLAINVITFFLFGLDKLKARKNWWRIPEATLLFLAIAGGSIGGWLGMKVFHHKTLHKKFAYGLPLIIVLQICTAIWLWIKSGN